MAGKNFDIAVKAGEFGSDALHKGIVITSREVRPANASCKQSVPGEHISFLPVIETYASLGMAGSFKDFKLCLTECYNLSISDFCHRPVISRSFCPEYLSQRIFMRESLEFFVMHEYRSIP